MTATEGEAKPALVCARAFDRPLIAAILIAAAVLVPRSIFIIHAQSPCFDDWYHLLVGTAFWERDFARLQRAQLNDPPLGDALSALPAYLNGVPVGHYKPLPEYVRYEIAGWKSLLFLPCIAVIFQWVRSVYCLGAAWLAWAMVLIEPTLAAHLPLPTIDVLGVEGVVIGSWALWRYVIQPTRGRLLVAVVAVAAALLMKHTTLLLPIVAVIFVLMHWLMRLKLWRQPEILRRNIRGFCRGIFLVLVAMWAFMLFDLSAPADGSPANPFFAHGPLRNLPLPNDLYFGSLIRGVAHADQGHLAYLLGKIGEGWWYYFPVVATYKIPVGTGLVALLGIASLLWVKPRYEELPLLICGGLWTIFLMAQHIDIGFRHFLPAEMFWIMLAARCVADGRLAPSIVAWTGAALAALHVALWTPDYLSYINFPRRAAYLDISDSNIDWGQGLKQLRHWMDAQPDDGRPIYFAYFGTDSVSLYDVLGPRLTEYDFVDQWIPRDPSAPLVAGLRPSHGILVLSPVCITGQYDQHDRFADLRPIPPKEIIGHCLLVYDLDELRAAGKIQ